MMIDTTLEETMFMRDVAGDPNFGKLTEDEVRDRMRPVLGVKTEEGIALYRRVYPKESPSYRWVYMTTDSRMYAKWAVPVAERTLRHCEKRMVRTLHDDFGGFLVGTIMDMGWIANQNRSSASGEGQIGASSTAHACRDRHETRTH